MAVIAPCSLLLKHFMGTIIMCLCFDFIHSDLPISQLYTHRAEFISSVYCTCLTGSIRQNWRADWRMPRANVIWCKAGSGDSFTAGGHPSNHPPLPKMTKISPWGTGGRGWRKRGGRLYWAAMRHQQTAESTAFLEQPHKIPYRKKRAWCSIAWDHLKTNLC